MGSLGGLKTSANALDDLYHTDDVSNTVIICLLQNVKCIRWNARAVLIRYTSLYVWIFIITDECRNIAHINTSMSEFGCSNLSVKLWNSRELKTARFIRPMNGWSFTHDHPIVIYLPLNYSQTIHGFGDEDIISRASEPISQSIHINVLCLAALLGWSMTA